MQRHEYTLKTVNPSRMSDYKAIRIHECPQRFFQSLDELREFIAKNIPSTSNIENIAAVEMGYIEPGHGTKGKKVWLCNDPDLKAMYDAHKRKRIINLWCYTEKISSRGKKRCRSPGKGGTYESHSTKKMAEVDDIYKKLQDKHKGKYSAEQLRTWSHLLEMGKHDSYEEPPDKPFFRGRRPSTTYSSPGTSESKPTPVGISPGKKVNMRSELIDQLQKWYQLLEMGGISQMQYNELKETILSDIKEL